MKNQPPQRSLPTEQPKPMPPGLLAAMLSRGRLLLCLDFDGTLSEIVPHPADARPLNGIPEVLTALTRDPRRINVAIVSGREIGEVRSMLGVDRGIMFSGTHGLEIVGQNGKRRVVPGVEAAMKDLDRVRAWLPKNLPGHSGFVIEDKQHAIAIHYRMANPERAAELRAALRSMVETEAPSLSILSGNKVEELLPRGIGGKGQAVRALMAEVGKPEPIPIYFGDDTTDEDAFHELREDGVGVLVGRARASWARYRVSSPGEVARVLAELAQELLHTAKPGAR